LRVLWRCTFNASSGDGLLLRQPTKPCRREACARVRHAVPAGGGGGGGWTDRRLRSDVKPLPAVVWRGMWSGRTLRGIGCPALSAVSSEPGCADRLCSLARVPPHHRCRTCFMCLSGKRRDRSPLALVPAAAGSGGPLWRLRVHAPHCDGKELLSFRAATAPHSSCAVRLYRALPLAAQPRCPHSHPHSHLDPRPPPPHLPPPPPTRTRLHSAPSCPLRVPAPGVAASASNPSVAPFTASSPIKSLAPLLVPSQPLDAGLLPQVPPAPPRRSRSHAHCPSYPTLLPLRA
jgi:hypothetical protein